MRDERSTVANDDERSTGASSDGDGVAQVRADAFECDFGGEAVLPAQGFDFAVLDELVGPADADDGGFDSLL